MKDEDLINLNDWLTVEQAVERLAGAGVPVKVPQLYQRANATTKRRRVTIKSREIVGRLCLLKRDVDRYGERLKEKRQAKQPNERRAIQ